MRIKKQLCFGLLFILTVACKEYTRIDFPSTENITFSVWEDTSLLALPLEMVKYKNHLFISDFKGDSLLRIYDIPTRKIIRKDLPYGDGPEEYLSPLQMVFTDSVLLLHNRWHYNCRKVIFNDDSLTYAPMNKIKLLPTDIDLLYPLEKDRYIASGRFSQGRYALLDKEGKITDFFGDYPEYKAYEKDIPNFPKFMFHQTKFAYSKEKKLLASVTNHVLEILDCSGTLPVRKKQVLLSSYDYSFQAGEGWATAEAEDDIDMGTRQIYATSQYIYILYNPNTVRQNKQQQETLPNEIWIFDWAGTPVKKLLPDKKASCLCVDENDDTLFCTVDDPDPTVGTYLINIHS